MGIGVRASSDIVHSVLYNERGAVQSQGVVQMPTLAPGRYYLTIEMPADSAPVLVQPIVFGLKEPDTRPPFEILRRYVEGRDNEALLYVPPEPEAEKAAPSARAAKARHPHRRARPAAEEGEETPAENGEEGEPQPAPDPGEGEPEPDN